MQKIRAIANDDGNILIMSVVIVALLIATGLGYMKWAVDERWDSAYEEATVQAYFLAQTGIVDDGMEFLRTREPGDLPQGTVFLLPRTITEGQEYVGEYKDGRVMRVTALGSGSVFERSDTYDIFFTGKARFKNHQKAYTPGAPHYEYVERSATLRARLRSFANYMYLTNLETTTFDEIIWFWHRDSLWGRVHSNDYIGIKYSPHFYGPISSSKEDFKRFQADPYFEYEPQFDVPPVYFPTTANSIRNNANPWISDGNGRFMTRIVMDEGNILFYQHALGSPAGDSLILSINAPAWGCIFVDGQAEIEGRVAGKYTIGTSGDMWLVNDITYVGADRRNGRFGEGPEEMRNFPNMLGLVSEKNIIIKNTFANGREDGMNAQPGNQARHSIVIDAGLVALGESFTFQHQNDDFEAYQGPTPDNRGIIHLTGAVTQWRRGYVHRSNHQDTGYGKDYLYDFRFDERPPPFYLEAVDENGNGLFDIISWGEITP